jgi:hypothetical protein
MSQVHLAKKKQNNVKTLSLHSNRATHLWGNIYFEVEKQGGSFMWLLIRAIREIKKKRKVKATNHILKTHAVRSQKVVRCGGGTPHPK